MAHPRLTALLAECSRAWPLIEKDSTYVADRTRRATTVQMDVQENIHLDVSTTADHLSSLLETVTDLPLRAVLSELVRYSEKERRLALALEQRALRIMHDVAHEAGFRQGVLYAQMLPAGIPEPMMN
jgi:hypothetical protein